MISGNLSFAQLTPVEQLALRIAGLDVGRIFNDIINRREIKQFIIQLNTEDQLFTKGENSLGVSLESIGGGYAAFTIAEKKKKGQPTDRVTLKDTGSFYKSFEVNVTPEYFDINADPIKDETDLFKEWGEEIVGLNEENLQLVCQVILHEIIRFVRFEI